MSLESLVKPTAGSLDWIFKELNKYPDAEQVEFPYVPGKGEFEILRVINPKFDKDRETFTIDGEDVKDIKVGKTKSAVVSVEALAEALKEGILKVLSENTERKWKKFDLKLQFNAKTNSDDTVVVDSFVLTPNAELHKEMNEEEESEEIDFMAELKKL